MKRIPIASTFGRLYVSMVCVILDLAKLARLESNSMSNPRRKHLEAVKWVKCILSYGLLQRWMKNDGKQIVKIVQWFLIWDL